MVLDRGRDGRALALPFGIAAAHETLQFGEFAHHLGDEIGLGQRRGALRLVRVGADQRRQLARQRRDALHPFALGAELFVEHDAVELFHADLRAAPRDPAPRRISRRDSRARTTRSLPATIAAPPSGATMLETSTKRFGQACRRAPG